MSRRLAGWGVVAFMALLVAVVGGGLWLIVRGIADRGDARESVTARARAERELQEALTDPGSGVAGLERVAGIDPGFAAAHRELGRRRLAAGDTAAAEADLRRALILDPFDPRAMLLLGRVLLSGGRTEDARGWYEKAALYARGDSTTAAVVRAALDSLPPGR